MRLRQPVTPRRTNDTKGFTLIEVLIAPAIIAVALGAAPVAVGALATRTGDARRMKQARRPVYRPAHLRSGFTLPDR
ncbi:prepilin-type N-terminal cleavage/methylation domain-containing protein [Paraburkholderia sp. BCC1885]|uniref:type II secretion system protein n=1 Tax=Paraburkholderia sp. BCC1885 TaxID=2562669 RepID=UPI00118410CD